MVGFGAGLSCLFVAAVSLQPSSEDNDLGSGVHRIVLACLFLLLL